jgi:hypothetical protein
VFSGACGEILLTASFTDSGNRLEAGTQVWADCPERYLDAVKALLRADVEAGKITAERYLEIVGEEYLS